MSGIAAFFQAVREKWHHQLRHETDQKDLLSYDRVPVARAARDDLDVWTNAYPPQAGGAESKLRIDRMMQAFRIDRRELEQDDLGYCATRR
jgi:hypothetical protein